MYIIYKIIFIYMYVHVRMYMYIPHHTPCYHVIICLMPCVNQSVYQYMYIIPVSQVTECLYGWCCLYAGCLYKAKLPSVDSSVLHGSNTYVNYMYHNVCSTQKKRMYNFLTAVFQLFGLQQQSATQLCFTVHVYTSIYNCTYTCM